MLNRATFGVPSNHSLLLGGNSTGASCCPIVIALQTGASEQAITLPKSLTAPCRAEVDLRGLVRGFIQPESLQGTAGFEKLGQ